MTHPCTITHLVRHKIPFEAPEPKKIPTLEEIYSDVCTVFDKYTTDVSQKGQKRDVIIIRKIYCYVAKVKTRLPDKVISNLIGRRDRTTAWHHHHSVSDFLKVKDPDFMPHWWYYLENSKLFTKYDFK